MEALTATIRTAIAAKDFTTLASVFSNSPSGWQSVGPGEQRSLASDCIVHVVAHPDFLQDALSTENDMVPVFTTCLGHLPGTVPDAADSALRHELFSYFLRQEEYNEAAQVLAGMRMEEDTASIYYTSPVEKADLYVQMAECFLAADDRAASDAAVTKAGLAVEAIPDKQHHTALLLRYKSTTARVLDQNRKFLAAATRYLELSQTSSSNDNTTNTIAMDPDELLQFLGRAATCAILAPSGPQRHRVLGHLVRDPLLNQLERLPGYGTHATIVRKMVRQQIVEPHELTQFQECLAEHQKAIMADGLTILERGVVEHNLIAVSQTYDSIYMADLAHILGVTASRAEKLAASMILEGSLQGAVMDQVEGLLEFAPPDPDAAWDRSLMTFCGDLNRVAAGIQETTVAGM